MRRGAAGLLLVVFALRALIPLGYMPVPEALGDGRYEIVICTAFGAKTIAVDADGQPVGPDRSGDSQADCPFAGIFSKALWVPAKGPAPAGDSNRLEVPFPALAFALLPPALGPPLGPRAPPSLVE